MAVEVGARIDRVDVLDAGDALVAEPRIASDQYLIEMIGVGPHTRRGRAPRRAARDDPLRQREREQRRRGQQRGHQLDRRDNRAGSAGIGARSSMAAMPSDPLVSVVVACHDGERFLAPALDSVLAQTHAASSS